MLELTIPAYWHRSANFGDALTPYILKKITGKDVVYCDSGNACNRIMVTGSILSEGNFENSIIWGNGFAWYGDRVFKPKEIWAVRGKMTKQKFEDAGVECPGVTADPAILLPELYAPDIKKKYMYGIMPHVVDFNIAAEMYSTDDVNVIDLRRPIERIIDEMLSCEKIISSSLHGLIAAHAYKIPAQWVRFSDKIIGDDFKYHDYFSSYDITPQQHYAMNFSRKLAWDEIPFLSQPESLPTDKLKSAFNFRISKDATLWNY